MMKIRVLALDDSELDLALLEENLDALPGWEVEFRGVSDPGEFRRLLAEGQVDISFIDHNMGDTTGLDVLRSLREAGVRTPIVALTAQPDREVVEEYSRVGSSDYIAKDALSPDLLLRSLRKVLFG